MSWVAPSAFAVDWPAPPQVRAIQTTRVGGISGGPYAARNLGDHVGDEAAAVSANRQQLLRDYGLPSAPVWLQQVHGTRVLYAPSAAMQPALADAVWTDQSAVVCAVLSADCLPVLLCSDDGTRVAAVHAGWRGLVDGVIEATVAALGVPTARLLAWLGPAIGPRAFEVGPEVRAAFIAADARAERCFVRGDADRWVADLFALARQRLHRAGVTAVYGGDVCTWSDPQRWYSYRRDGVCGRMATLIWRAPMTEARIG